MDLDNIVNNAGIGRFFLHQSKNESANAGFSRDEVIRFKRKFRNWQDSLKSNLISVDGISYLFSESHSNLDVVSNTLLLYLYREEMKDIDRVLDSSLGVTLGKAYDSIYRNTLSCAVQRIRENHVDLMDVREYIDAELLLGGYVLDVPIGKDMIRTPSHLFDVYAYSKGSLTNSKSGNMAIAMQAGVPSKCINPYFELNVDEPFASQNIEGVVRQRVNALKEGPVYVKPKIGSCGKLIMKLNYNKDQDILHMESPYFHDLLMLYTDDGFYNSLKTATIMDKRMPVQSSSMNALFFIDPSSIDSIQNDDDFDVDIFLSRDALGLELVDRVDLKPLKYLHNFEAVEFGDSILFNVKPHQLSRFVKGLELLYYGLGVNSNWDREINCPKIGNMPFEVRMLWMNGTAMTHSRSDSYAKVSTNGFLNGISDGGVAMKTHLALEKSLSAYFPNDSTKETKDKVEFFVDQMGQYFKLTKKAIQSNYVKQANLLRYPSVPGCDVVSVDFMIDADAMQAYAIDVNLLAGVQGFKNTNEVSYSTFSAGYDMLRELTQEQVITVARNFLNSAFSSF